MKTANRKRKRAVRASSFVKDRAKYVRDCSHRASKVRTWLYTKISIDIIHRLHYKNSGDETSEPSGKTSPLRSIESRHVHGSCNIEDSLSEPRRVQLVLFAGGLSRRPRVRVRAMDASIRKSVQKRHREVISPRRVHQEPRVRDGLRPWRSSQLHRRPQWVRRPHQRRVQGHLHQTPTSPFSTEHVIQIRKGDSSQVHRLARQWRCDPC